MSNKYYVVWIGREVGVFSDWPRAQQAVHGFAGARYKSFTSRAEAEQAFSEGKNSANYPRRSAAKPAVKEEPVPYASESMDVRIYCDGACEPNPGEAGSGIALYRHSELAELWYGLYNPNGTNNSAELNALYRALLMAKGEIERDQSVEVLSDSQYSINCVRTWAAGWKKKGWKKAGGDIKNLDIIQQCYELYMQIGTEMQLTHVAGHAGIEGNELADRMAVLAAQSKQVDLKQYEGELNIPVLLKMKAG